MTKAIAIHFYTGEKAPCKARITLDNYTHDASKVTCKNCLAWLERRKPKTTEETPMATERKRPTKTKKTETPATEAPATESPAQETTDQPGDELERIALAQLQKVAANMNEALGFDPPMPADSEDRGALQEAIKSAATEIVAEDNPAGENVKKSLAENADFPHLTEETWAFLMEAGMLAHLAPVAAPEKKKGGAAKKKAPTTAAKKSGPGVISTILELIKKTSKDAPITKDFILQELTKAFPDREATRMAKTVNVQLPTRMSKERGVNIVSGEGGYYLAP